jgi:hypothetical protein
MLFYTNTVYSAIYFDHFLAQAMSASFATKFPTSRWCLSARMGRFVKR